MIKNIVWDFDGTLFDTSPARTYALSKTLNELGYPAPLNLIDGMIRRSYEDCIDSLRKRYRFSVNEVHRTFNRHYSAIPRKNQALFPGVIDVCEWIRANGGVNIVITDRDLNASLQFLNEYCASTYFSEIFSIQDMSQKPISAILSDLMRQYHLDPQITLMIGDQEKDIQAGRTAGAKTCLFGDPGDFSQADWQIKNYSQLLEILRLEAVGRS